MKVISASRRTDLVAFYPEWLARAARDGAARVVSPSGRRARADLDADLRPEAVHTLVLWSKDFSNLLGNAHGLADALRTYEQVYTLFTVSGLGGTRIEPGAPPPNQALAQLPALIAFVGDARRVSIRFDPVVHWTEGGWPFTNLDAFEDVAEAASRAGIEDLRISFAQWYRKAIRRARLSGFDFVDPAEETKIEAAARMSELASGLGLRLWACSQAFLTRAPGVRPSACIDGRRLAELHPRRLPAPTVKDRSQRAECGCTVSVDIGSYTQACPHACLYCYANPTPPRARPAPIPG
jgi:hypothetical protein